MQDKSKALAFKIKDLFDQHKCRGLVTFADSNNVVTTAATDMHSEIAIALMSQLICNFAVRLDVAPELIVENLSALIDGYEKSHGIS